MELSKRLAAIAAFVTEGSRVADVGTDHGYVPIYLAESGKSPHIIAMDVNPGPAGRAREHVREHGLEQMIEVRVSDGLKGLGEGEADTVIVSGMGGSLMIRILEESQRVAASVREFILQPQSEIFKARAYLNRSGFRLTGEEMVEEDGKFYTIMKLIRGEEPEFTELELYYGRKLLAGKHGELRRFLLREERRVGAICESLKSQRGANSERRLAELLEELSRIRRGLSLYEM